MDWLIDKQISKYELRERERAGKQTEREIKVNTVRIPIYCVTAHFS